MSNGRTFDPCWETPSEHVSASTPHRTGSILSWKRAGQEKVAGGGRENKSHNPRYNCVQRAKYAGKGKSNLAPRKFKTLVPNENNNIIISAEQKARISSKFRAAKALLSRKRPLRDGCQTNCPRLPLKEILVADTPSLVSPGEIVSTDAKYSRSCSENKSTESDCDPAKLNSPLSGASAVEFELSGNRGECSNLNCDISWSDELDEAVLKEIDALCEQRSAKKIGKPDLISDSSRSYSGEESKNRSVTTSEVLDTGGRLEFKDEPDELGVKVDATSEDASNEALPDVYSKYLDSLNDQQREAACCDVHTPLMIVAGPGSGKTSTMVGRVLMLLHKGIAPSNILAMTFTTAAASEMRDRIASVAGKGAAKELTISTFHSFCLQLCRSHAEKLGRTSEFLVYGHAQQRRAVIEAVRLLENSANGKENLETSKPGHSYIDWTSVQCFKDKSKKWQKFVTQAKASGRSSSACLVMGDEIGAKLLGNYDGILASCNAFDYHDLISYSGKLLTDFPEVFEECQNLWKAIVIDEFQDTSAMQYSLLRKLASHNCVTVVGDEDQSIFSFNGADISGFDSFREDFPNHKEIRLIRNYRSTRCIVEAASSLIHNNVKRCSLKKIFTDNSSGCKITVKECHNEDSQCAFVIDKLMGTMFEGLDVKCSYSNIAVLYRRQVSGKAFQIAFRHRKIPFNVHGVAFYRKKVIRAIMSMLRTTLPGCDDGPFRQVFKALLPFEKEDKKRVVDYIDKISSVKKCSFISAASDIFTAKISGTFKRSQLTQGRKVLLALDMISKLVQREQSISSVVTSVANMLPQKYLLEQRAILDVDGGKYLNEESDFRSILQYLLDDVAEFLSTYLNVPESEGNSVDDVKGCTSTLKAFVDYVTMRESENFRSRRKDNEDSVTLTTIHQSKGLEWDVVFIIKANETEIPLSHEFNGLVKDGGTTLEEERRLFYVAMTRARKKLFILYVTMDANWQLLQPSIFLKEIPSHLLDVQADLPWIDLERNPTNLSKRTERLIDGAPKSEHIRLDVTRNEASSTSIGESISNETVIMVEACNGNNFLKRFSLEDRSIVSQLFHQWAKKKAFEDPKRLLDKRSLGAPEEETGGRNEWVGFELNTSALIGFVIDERLRIKKNKHKDVLRALKSCLQCNEAFQYAEYVIRWEKIPIEKRAHLMSEKQEHFKRLRIENAMGSSAATSKQIAINATCMRNKVDQDSSWAMFCDSFNKKKGSRTLKKISDSFNSNNTSIHSGMSGNKHNGRSKTLQEIWLPPMQVPYRSLRENIDVSNVVVEVPALLIMGGKDYTLKFPSMEEYLNETKAEDYVPNLEIVFLDEGTHFVQEQFSRPSESAAHRLLQPMSDHIN
ncbi:hypothetical protein Scep_007244 [Stephania cephalantha]|uniref:DNA 3'-5' helicase n=1 Tax=Stephania cephalantha TaxID=152367 RepID=A0AAP0KC37_9MAGN